MEIQNTDIFSPEDYIKDRVDGQIAWFDQKSIDYQKWYKRYRKIEVAITSAMLVIGILPLCNFQYNKMLLIGLGAIAAFLRACCDIEKYHDLWIKYRTTAGLLAHEKYLYLNQASAYLNMDKAGSYRLFVEKIEHILTDEEGCWEKIMQQKKTVDTKESAVQSKH